MSHSVDIYVIGTTFAGSIFALMGTNAQASLAKQRLLRDNNPLVQEAARLWTPGRRWLLHRGHQRLQNVFEMHLREREPAEWTRYLTLTRELWAWNALESGVALLSGAAVAALINIFI